MNPGTLVSLALAAGVAAFVLAPLLRKDTAEDEVRTSAGSELQDLRSRHDMALAALRDLEDDRATGKIDERDYEQLKNRLTTQAVEILKKLDAHERTHPSIAKRRRAGKR